MKKIFGFWITITIFIFSFCKNPDNSIMKETLKAKKYNQIIDRNLLNGIWAENEFENANFYIKKDSMYFVEDSSPCFIKISTDTLITYYDGLITYDKIIKLDKDSLILLNEVGEFIKLKRRL